MKLKKGFVLREVAGQKLVIATGEASKSFKGMIKLNESAATIWQWLIDGTDSEKVAEKLTETYGLSPEQAAEEAARFVEKIAQAGFFEE